MLQPKWNKYPQQKISNQTDTDFGSVSVWSAGLITEMAQLSLNRKLNFRMNLPFLDVIVIKMLSFSPSNFSTELLLLIVCRYVKSLSFSF